MLFYLINIISSQFEPLNTFLGESFESIHSLSIAVFCCLITLYFTVLGIVLGRNKISFVQFWKFSITKSFVTASVLLITSVFFLFFPNIITLKIFNLNIASLVCILFFISLVVFSVEAIKSTEFILNKNKGYERAKYLLNKSKSINDVCEICSAAFFNSRLNDEITVLYDLFKFGIVDKKNAYKFHEESSKIIGNLILGTSSICESYPITFEELEKIKYNNTSFDNFEKALDLISTGCMFLVEELKKNRSEIIEQLYDRVRLYFRVYKNFYYKYGESIKKSYLLYIKDIYKFSDLVARNDFNSNDRFDFYKLAIDESKSVVLWSLHVKNKKVTEDLIGDYTFYKQFLYDKNICDYFDESLIDIITEMIAEVVAKVIEFDDVAYLIPKILSHIDEIAISQIDYKMYTEFLPSVKWERVKYSKKFFINLMFIFLLCLHNRHSKFKSPDYFNDNINKIKPKSFYKTDRYTMSDMFQDLLSEIYYEECGKINYRINIDDYLISGFYKIDALDFENGLDSYIKIIKNKIRLSDS